MDIQKLRAMRNSDFGAISSAFEKVANPQSEQKSFTDDRFWRLEGDKAGNGTATIRFLPRVEGDELPWVRIFSHGFQGPTGKWYIENDLSTIKQKDPVGDLASRLWNSGIESDKDEARKVAQVILSDPANTPQLAKYNNPTLAYLAGMVAQHDT